MVSPTRSHIQVKPAFAVIKPFSIIEERLQQVQTVIGESLRGEPLDRRAQTKDIQQLLTHIRSQSGKMLRPGLLLLSGLCCGQINDEHITVASIFEIIHEATLLHDDVIDEARKRRGQSTVNELYGNASAVLLGDFLLSTVFSTSAELKPSLAKDIAAVAGSTCRGELNQNFQKRNWQLSEDQYIRIIADKTAAIFSSCSKTGAELSGADKTLAENFARFGLKLGIAFQIADDILDIVGDEKKAGKTLGTDLFEAKPTLPLIHLLSTIADGKRDDIITLVETGRAEVRSELAAIMTNNGSLEYSRRQVRRYIDQSSSALEPVPQCPAKKALLDTAQFVLSLIS